MIAHINVRKWLSLGINTGTYQDPIINIKAKEYIVLDMIDYLINFSLWLVE